VCRVVAKINYRTAASAELAGSVEPRHKQGRVQTNWPQARRVHVAPSNTAPFLQIGKGKQYCSGIPFRADYIRLSLGH